MEELKERLENLLANNYAELDDLQAAAITSENIAALISANTFIDPVDKTTVISRLEEEDIKKLATITKMLHRALKDIAEETRKNVTELDKICMDL